jgi:hypothetical protein
MKIPELIELLQRLPEDAEVHLVQQPSWPVSYSLSISIPLSVANLTKVREQLK